jgi:hypothetical protein
LIFFCALAKLVWQVILCAFQLARPPKNTTDLFGNWIKSFLKIKDTWSCVEPQLCAGFSGKLEMMCASIELLLVTQRI